MPGNLKVFCSHTAVDKPLVQDIAAQLAQAGIDPWVDAWEILPGENIVAKVNQGLADADAGIIFCSKQAMASDWVQNELNTLLQLAIEQQKPLIPVMIDPDTPLPPLLQSRLNLDSTNVEGLINAIYGRTDKPRVAPPRGQARERRFRITLRALAPERLMVEADLDGEPVGEAQECVVGVGFHFSYRAFLSATLQAKSAASIAEAAAQHDQHLIELGRNMGQVVFPAPIAEALTALLDETRGLDEHLLLSFEMSDARLLSMPFEAARLPDGRAPALEPGMRILRQYTARANPAPPPLAGPLRILVAVAAPDEGQTSSSVLDRERELQTILDTVDRARQYGQYGRAEVTILEVAHPDEIQRALSRQRYHVLHISGHGQADAIEMEDEDGAAVLMTPSDLAQAMRDSGQPAPLVFLSTCLSGGGVEDTAGFAQSLLAQGAPAALAMQGRVSDWYATQLAGAFYDHLNHMPIPLASRALALARQEVEQARRRALERGDRLPVYQAEYATPALFCAAEERPLLDRDVPPKPSPPAPRSPTPAQMPQLSLGELIGRRAVMRRVMRVLQDDQRLTAQIGRKAGVLIRGIGGVGKSALAGRIMARVSAMGWTALAMVGRWGLGELALTIGGQLLDHPDADLDALGRRLLQAELPDAVRLQKLQELLAQHRVLLVLDNFEDNLTLGGQSFLDPTTEDILTALCDAAERGKLLLTSRYPAPDSGVWLADEPLGPLSAAETRKLLHRLPALVGEAPEALGLVLSHIGGHPRMLEYLDALLRGGQARLPEVAKRLREQARELGLELTIPVPSLDSAMRDTLQLGAVDILLDQLIDLIEAMPGDLEALYQASVFALPVDIHGLAFAQVGSREPSQGEIDALGRRMRRLVETSLLTPLGDGMWWVHRWTAQSLKTKMDEATFRACCLRAGEYRMWRVENISGSLVEATEAVRRFLQAEAFDRAAEVALGILAFMQRYTQLADVAAFAAEMLDALLQDHADYPVFCFYEADALLSLGRIGQAMERHQEAFHLLKMRADAEPDWADYQRDLSVSHNKMGDLLRVLGQGEQARQHYDDDLAIAQRLANAEPDRADYQRDLSVSHERMGDLLSALGQGEQARQHYDDALAIRQRLANAEPDRADYQRDLSVSHNKMGDLLRALGQGEQARQHYDDALAIRQRLANAEPDRADYQRDLSVSHERMGDLLSALGQGEQARQHYDDALAIRQRLANAEPDRADYQRDLSVSHERMGDLLSALGQGEQARQHYDDALAIAQRLANAEPDRADYQRDLSVSHNKMGDLLRALGQGEQARQHYDDALAIAQRLANAEPDRADYQRDLSVSHERMGDLLSALGQGERARQHYDDALAIRQRLVNAEPDRADYQWDLAVSLGRMADISPDQTAEYVAQALDILHPLHSDNRLYPDQVDYMQQLEHWLNAPQAPSENMSLWRRAARLISRWRR